MRVLIINSVSGIRSTGSICTDIANSYISEGHDCIIAYGREVVPEQYKEISHCLCTRFGVIVNAMKARILDNEGFNAKHTTKKFIKWANNYNPDVLWLHNLHGYYINIEILFDWIKSRPQMKVNWTLHDCWPFTGHCSHFSYVNCEQWKKQCYSCVQSKEYPKSILFDRCKKNYTRKKNAFIDVEKMTIITPSMWLRDLVKQSFLKDYTIEVNYNTVDTSVFKPTASDFKKRYGIENKIMLLGVATAWTHRKGLYDFVELSKKLDDKYRIVLVGLSKKQILSMPQNIICLERTNSKKELAEIYTAADLFLNLSKEETFGLTTVEAISCGTIPIVLKGTACEEITKMYGGVVVEPNVEVLVDVVIGMTN